METASSRRIVLVLMVKNESKIIERCMQGAVPICDAFCIVDTGSTDDTVGVAQAWLQQQEGQGHARPFRIAHHEWVNFGRNRSLSFGEGVAFCQQLGWDPRYTWALFLDGDMVLRVGDAFCKDMALKDAGYQVMQRQGTLEYYNLRLARMDVPWKCTGATHEYWESCLPEGAREKDTTEMEPGVLAIDDVNDGGAKADKFERDIRLLLAEYETRPRNPRTLFYLAQSYQNCGKPEQAIPWYKRRLEVDGWHEEGWYAKLSLGRCYLAIKKPIEAEFWLMDCFEGNHRRAEPLYELAKHFRETGEHFKAMHYCTKAMDISKPSKGLFVDSEVYSWKLRFERTILDYYITRRTDSRSALESITGYLSDPNTYLKDQVHANLKFYIMPLIAPTAEDDSLEDAMTHSHSPAHPLFRTPIAGPSLLRHNDQCRPTYTPYDFPLRLGTYTASSMSVLRLHDGKWIANVRYVNYRIGERSMHGGRDVYLHPHGGADTHRILTRNFLCELDPVTFDVVPGTLCSQPWNDTLPDLPRHPDRNVLGLEDLRLFHPAPEFVDIFDTHPEGLAVRCSPVQSSTLLGFSCAQMEYSEHGKIRIAMGLVDTERFTCTRGAVVESPHGREMWCEKNWIPLSGGMAWIYGWHPMRIGRVVDKKLQLGLHEYQTPSLFNEFRGSSAPVSFRGQLWLVTHLKYIDSNSAMTYAHSLLALDERTYKPLRYSVPFFFRKEDVEFCLSFAISMAGNATFFFSQRDARPARITCPLADIPMLEL